MQMIKYVQKIQIVIDALDKYKTRRELLLWLENLACSGHASLHIFTTSRKEEDVETEITR